MFSFNLDFIPKLLLYTIKATYAWLILCGYKPERQIVSVFCWFIVAVAKTASPISGELLFIALFDSFEY